MIAAAAVGLAAPAFAEPVYLECTLVTPSNGRVMLVDVTLNEDAGTASFLMRETGWAPRNMPALFTARDVTINQTSSLGDTNIYTVDRTTLAFVEDNRVGEKSIFKRQGTCSVVQVERAF
jgi:hypothetical protein